MKKALTVLMALVLTGALFAAPAAAQNPFQDQIRRVPNPVKDSYIVTLREGTASDVPQAANALANAFNGRLVHVYTHAVQGFSIQMSEAAAQALARSPLVASVEQDGVATAAVTQSNAPYGLDRIDQRDLPLSTTYSYLSDGTGVHAYVLDTGIRTTHQEFGGRATVGVDEIGGGQNGNDCNGHGTHVAGTIGSNTYGVAKGVSLVAVRVLDCLGNGSWSQVIAGIDWVTANAIKPAVANMSLSGGLSTTVDTAVANSINSGITYALAAGNSSTNACNASPGDVPAALTVGAIQSNDAKASYSNYGTCLDLFAPGSSITSTYNTSDSATATLSGTSMASPHVAGAAAAYLATNTTANPAVVTAALIDNSTLNKVTSPGTGSPNRLLYTGFIGPAGPPPPNTAPVANFNFSCTGLSCGFTDTSTDAQFNITSRAWTFGDGTSSSATNPSKTYAAAGSYTVGLTVTDAEGLNSTIQKTVSVEPVSDPDPSTPNLNNGVSASGTSAARGSFKYFKILVPSGKSTLKVDLASVPACSSGCNPDLDLYVRKTSKPTTGSYTCRGYTASSIESCTVNNPGTSAWWYVGVRTYSGTKTGNFTIKATWSPT